MSDTIFGWELTYKTVESSLSKNTDVLVAFIHFFLLKNKLKIVGIGDEKSVNQRDKERQSELLPEGWNQMENGVYKLRYLHDNKLYILHATEVDDLLITNLLDVETLKVSNVTFRIGDTVVLNAGSALTAVKNASEIYDKLNSELLQPVFAGAAKSTQTQTEKKEDRSLLLERRIPPNLSDPVIPDFDRRFPGVGRGDLDPFGRGISFIIVLKIWLNYFFFFRPWKYISWTRNWSWWRFP